MLGDEAPDLPELEKLAGDDADRGVRTTVVRTQIASLGDPPADAHDVYLRLHLLSHRLLRPHEANLDGVFGLLANVVWTNHGPCAVPELRGRPARLRARGPVTVYGVDKFPRMVDYVLPAGCGSRTPTACGSARTSPRARRSCTRASSTTTPARSAPPWSRAGSRPGWCRRGLGPRRRRVDHGDALGGGTAVISVGRGCLIGANAGIGISLGNDCVVEAGLYVTAGTKVTLPDGDVVAARTLSGQDGLLLRRNSVTGAVEALPRTGEGVALNAVLHAN